MQSHIVAVPVHPSATARIRLAPYCVRAAAAVARARHARAATASRARTAEVR